MRQPNTSGPNGAFARGSDKIARLIERRKKMGKERIAHDAEKAECELVKDPAKRIDGDKSSVKSIDEITAYGRHV
jgi:hypothetical protein